MIRIRDRLERRMHWLLFSLRWLLLAGAAGLILAEPGAQPQGAALIALIIVATLYNVGLTLVEFIEYWHPNLDWAILAADSALALGLFLASGLGRGPLIWIGLLPALTVALRKDWWTTLVVSIMFTAAQAGSIIALEPSGLRSFGPLAITAAILWPLTVGTALVAGRLRGFVLAALHQEHTLEMQQVKAMRAHARAIFEMSTLSSATADYDSVLEAVLNFGVMAGGQSAGEAEMVGAVLIFRDDLLYVQRAYQLAAADLRVACPAREGVLGDVIRTSEPALIAAPSDDPELEQFAGLRACRSLIAFPLRAGFETLGAVIYAHTQPDFFDEDVCAYLKAVVRQAIIALENVQLYGKLRAEKERLMEVQAEAQIKLARDLHDGPTQSIAALAMRANFVHRLLERDAQEAGEEMTKIEHLARRTTKELRHMLFTLRPLVLESQGLTSALQQLALKMRETHGQNVIVEIEAGLESQLDIQQQAVLFYIAEEAAGNARKHAEAQHIWVRLKTQRDRLVMEIQDDGVGFNVGAVDADYDIRGSLGLVNMRERAEMLNGTVKVASTEGEGTRITVYIPLRARPADQPAGGAHD